MTTYFGNNLKNLFTSFDETERHLKVILYELGDILTYLD